MHTLSHSFYLSLSVAHTCSLKAPFRRLFIYHNISNFVDTHKPQNITVKPFIGLIDIPKIFMDIIYLATVNVQYIIFLKLAI